MQGQYSVTEESLASLASYWNDSRLGLKWEPIFVLPAFLQTWWQAFGAGAELYLRAVWQGEKIMGIAPLQVRGKTAAIIGSTDVSDYVDFIIVPGNERTFFTVLLQDLAKAGIKCLDLRPVRRDSAVVSHLVPLAQEQNYTITCNEEEVSVELDLPHTWEEYLLILNRKQRHEVKRKLRRLREAGGIDYGCAETSDDIAGLTDTFLKLFSLGHEEKAHFMTAPMESFFRSLLQAMAAVGLLRFGVLRLDGSPAAMLISFDYGGAIYLYNSAYDPSYSYLSVGLLSKVLCIKDSIERGRRKWDFLKGAEPYKHRLGGREVPLYYCQITMP